ncbi:Cytochrome c [Muriicola jejuensis]|uniref:C-type cytochrome n=1 Tax=Muriicola jejuensis TaxID=504488 RepID=A0A6P0UAS7_9FLAO|nr:cytochrome c [Muriicola jejuensis]NER09610.1 c-type cytochrome [Muriicola jejuensis]SMP07442.1 Cytochrome c [Muriicola jejuensis]
MKITSKLIALLCAILLFSCGGKEEKKDGFSLERSKVEEAPAQTSVASDEVPASQRITLDEKGVGQIKEITLDPEINTAMAAEGEAIFKTNCTACHKLDKRFIGPSPKGILERRSPEWIMNMILDPQLMTEQDRCAKDLLVEFNGAAMANQNLTLEQTRAILEYFRTL